MPEPTREITAERDALRAEVERAEDESAKLRRQIIDERVQATQTTQELFAKWRGERDQARSERDALSTLLRGMARRVGDFRRDVVRIYDQGAFAIAAAGEDRARPSVSDQTPASPDDAAARHMADVTRHPRFAELYAQAAHNVHARDNHDQGDERAEAAVPAVHAEWDPDGDFRSADCLAKGCPLCASSDWAKRQVPSSVQDNTERCGHRSVWKGCARIKGHDGGGHSTYPLTEEDKRAAQARKTTDAAPSSVQGDTTPEGA